MLVAGHRYPKHLDGEFGLRCDAYGVVRRGAFDGEAMRADPLVIEVHAEYCWVVCTPNGSNNNSMKMQVLRMSVSLEVAR
jgi:hypothetical protein